MKIQRSRTLKSAKYIKKQRKQLIWNISLSTIAVILVLVVVVLLIRLSSFQIKNIEIQGGENIDSAEVEKTVRTTLAGNYVYFIPRTNFLFYPKAEIHTNILEKYKKVVDVHISTKNFSTLVLNLTKRQPHVIVCGGFEEDDCFYSDADAYIYAQSQGGEFFKYYSNVNATSTEIGSQFVSKERFDELQKIVHDVSAAGIVVTGLLVSDDNSYELYIKNSDESIAVVYFDDRSSFDKMVSNLVTFWQNAHNKKIGLDSVPNFDYINLRFGNNVFYLIKENGGLQKN